ncbi:MAG: CDP-diacylglycerol--glycerol-3-phosphate 3-phosphatidyltransferase [Clostridia bacterium]|nr:CDP-diacylglycerol--glycerol-3-phosphate 3-phosphatidyltransferase [Clostridia bacterium]
MNTPNKITVCRMFIAPLFLLIYLSGFKYRFFVSAAVFILGAITDFIDGNMARKRNIVTNFGKLLDPIADKMLVAAALLAFMNDGFCNIWFVMLILTRDFAVTSVRMIASSQGVVIPANIWGKAKTVTQMVSMIAVMLLAGFNSAFALNINVSLISNIIMAVVTAVTVVSGIIYIVDSRKVIKYDK